jgi:hypothetical protein
MDEGYTVYTTRYDSEIWCESCRDDNAFYCSYADNYYSTDSVDMYIVDSHETWSSFAAERHAHYCDKTEEYYSHPSVIVIVDEDGTKESWCYDAFNGHGFVCDHSDENYSNDMKHETDCGKIIANIFAGEYESGDIETSRCDETADMFTEENANA